MSLIELNGIKKYYGKQTSHAAVDDLNLSVGTGEVMVLLGPSGCGKTTTLRLIAGFEQPESGEVKIRGRIVASPSAFVPPDRRGVGMVFQDYALFPHLTVSQNIMFGVKGITRAQKKERLEEVLALVGLERRGDSYPHQISGGQQQRVALARALAPRPEVILLDEPLSNLDADLRVRMRTELDGILRKANITAIMVTHDQEDAFSLADRIAILNEGRLEQVGTPEEIYHEPATRFVADFVGQADFILGTVGEKGVTTALGFIPATSPFPAGEEVEVMVRPDDVLLVPDDRGSAEIIERRFRGSDIVYRVALGSDEAVDSIQPSHISYDVGQRVRATAGPAHIVLLSPRTGEVHSCKHPELHNHHPHLIEEHPHRLTP